MGPVLGRTAVPTLVDAEGYFFASAAELYNNKPISRKSRESCERRSSGQSARD